MAYNRTYYSNFVSNAGITWRIEMYDQVATATYQNKEGTLGPKAGEMKYGSEGSKMFAPLKPSTFSFEFMVTTQNAANYIKQLKASRQERDVYVAIYRETVNGSNSPIYTPYWAGQVLMDLSDDPDIPMPYPITIKAVDGIASLKYYDYVPSTTSQLASHIYDIGDTYIPDPTNAGGQYAAWQTCIEIISNCLDYSGPFTTTIGSPNNPEINTNVRWFNGEHPNTTIDPLSSTRIKPNMFYKEENEGKEIKYKAQNCYDVLQNLCKAWGMRMYFFAGRYYFTQINEWRIADSGTQASPVNMKRHGYTMAGASSTTGNSITRWWGQYTLPLTNTQTDSEYKNLKLTGGKYGLLPAFKRVTIDFANVDNVNSFTTFPLLPTGGTTAPTTAGTYWEFSSLGTYTFDGINDQTFFNRIYLAISNNGISPGNLTLGWAMVVRPAGTGSNTLNASPNSNGWTHYSQPDTTNTPPIQWINNTVTLNTGSMPNTPQIPIGIGNTTVDITTGTYANWPFFPASTFTAGDWEIGYYVRSDTTGNALYWSEHGRFVPTGVSNPYTSPWQNNVNYQNVATTQGINASEFAPIINGAIGAASTTTNLYQTGNDTAYEEVKDIIMGDTGSNFSEGCIQIYTGTVWKASDFSGIWGIDTLAGGNSFSQQLAEDIFKAQAKPIDKFTVSTTINAENSVYWNDGTANRPQWAAPYTKFNTFSNANQGMVAKKYIMHTGSYDFLRDTWKWVLYEQATFTVGATSTTTTTLGVNSGLSGGDGNPTPTDPNYGSIAPPPNPESGNQIAQRLLLQQQIQPVATIRVGRYLTPIVGIPSLTITSLSVKKLPAAIFKIGDKLVLQTASNDTRAIVSEDTNPQYNTNRIEFVVSANQSINAETISVTSKTIYQDISVGDTITFNAANLYSQYQNKTEGSVAGFEVDADGLTKDGVEITGWLNSDTMAGATANNVPTAESVKAYVDGQAGHDETLQQVTDNGNTTTNSVMIGSTSAPSEKLQVSGTLAITQNDTAYSGGYFTKIKSGYNANPFIIESKYGDLIKAEDYGKALSFHTGSTATSEKIRILSNGNVGIGTTSPLYPLDVYGRLRATSFKLGGTNGADAFNIFYSSDNATLWNYEDGYMRFGTNASERMRITSAGNVGIGTTSPISTLDVNGTISLSGETENKLYKASTSPANGTVTNTTVLYGRQIDLYALDDIVLRTGTSASDDIIFFAGNSEKARIKGSGNIGIGTTSPSEKLEISGNIKLTPGTERKITIGYGTGIKADSNTNFLTSFAYASAELEDTRGFNWINGSGNTEKMRLLLNGNLGIGTTSPNEKLDVVGNIRVQNNGQIYADGTGDLFLGNTNSGRLKVGGNGNDTIISPFFNSLVVQTSRDQDDIIFKGGNSISEIMRIDTSAGNVGIGTTAPTTKLNVNGGASITNGLIAVGSSTAGNLLTPGIFIGGDGTNGLIYSRQQNIWKNCYLDSANLYLNAQSGGNVGIGTTAPLQKLHINGNVLLENNKELRWKDSGGAERTILELTNSNDLYFGGSFAGSLIFVGGGSYTERMRIADNGNVGIGTTSPGGKLQINEYTVGSQGSQGTFGNVSSFSNSGSNNLFLGIKNSTYPNRGWAFNPETSGVNSDLVIKEYGLNGERFRIKSGGNVGIGTSNPTAKLESISPNGSQSSLRLGRGDNSNYWDFNHAGNDLRIFNNATSGSNILLGVDPGGGVENNNVGIGTATPSEKLHIVGDTFIDGGLKVNAENIDFTGLGTTDPSVAGRLWSDRGILKISSGE